LYKQFVKEGHATAPVQHRHRSGRVDKARALEDLSWLSVAAMKNGSPFFYRFAIPGEL